MINKNINYDWLKSRGLIIYEVISGSVAYGTNLETSDEDRRYVYILPEDYILTNNIIEQVNDSTNDVVGYEVSRFLELLKVGNPNILELLNTPDDCIIYKNLIFDLILEKRNIFLTKRCSDTFAGYAFSQIKKAKGQNKKQNWEKIRFIRKNPIDFCYIHIGEKTFNLTDYLLEHELDQKFCGLTNMPHSKDLLGLFYDYGQHFKYSNGFLNRLIYYLFFKFQNPLKFKGISFIDSNEIRLSSIPKETPKSYFLGHITYNKDGYSNHCKEYKSYQEWISNKNESRWVDSMENGQKIDGKNLMHCVRLIKMSEEIANGSGIIVRRNPKDIEYLLNIRRGGVKLDHILNDIEDKISYIKMLFEMSDLPNSVDDSEIDIMLLKIRKEFYGSFILEKK